MNYFELSRKMILYNLNAYIVFITGNIFAVALLFSFTALYLNQTFMNETIVDPMISSNIFFPGLLIAVFFVIMILVSGAAFWRERLKEYAVMTVLGMSRKEVIYNVVCENVFAALILLPVALAAGTALSFFFYVVVRYGIGIIGIVWLSGGKAYILIILMYGIFTLLSILVNIVIYSRKRLIHLLRETDTEYDGMFSRILKKLAPEYWNHSLPRIAFLRQHKKIWNIRYTIVVLLISGLVCLLSICISLYPSFIENAVIYSPYDMLYVEIHGMNQGDEEQVNAILRDNNIGIEEYEQFEFARDTVYNYVAESVVNTTFGCGYEIESGECINLFQFYEEDGYAHDYTPALTVNAAKNVELNSIGSDTKILWNGNPAFADRTLIVNDNDYYSIVNGGECHVGKVNLYKFSDWMNSENAVTLVDDYLQMQNGVEWDEQYYYRVSSKIGQYRKARQSGHFLIFVMSFAILMLWIAALSIVITGLKSEQNEIARLEKCLYCIGTTKEKIKSYVVFRNHIRIMIPIAAGEVIGLFFAMLWNHAAYQMNITVILIEIVTAVIIALVSRLFADGFK